MTDAKRLLDHDQHRAEEVGEAVPSRKCYRQATDAEPGKHRIGREAQLVGPLDQESDGNRNAGKAHAESDKLAVKAAASQMLRRYDGFSEKAGGDHGKPGGAEVERAGLNKGDDDAQGAADPENCAEQRYRDSRHQNDGERGQKSMPPGTRVLRPSAGEKAA